MNVQHEERQTGQAVDVATEPGNPGIVWMDGTPGIPDIPQLIAERTAKLPEEERQAAYRLGMFYTLETDSLEAAYVALADVTEAYVTAKLDAEAAELYLKLAKAKAWDQVTADCRNDAARERAMMLAFEPEELNLAGLQREAAMAKLEVDLAKLEVERNKTMWTVQTGISL